MVCCIDTGSVANQFLHTPGVASSQRHVQWSLAKVTPGIDIATPLARARVCVCVCVCVRACVRVCVCVCVCVWRNGKSKTIHIDALFLDAFHTSSIMVLIHRLTEFAKWYKLYTVLLQR